MDEIRNQRIIKDFNDDLLAHYGDDYIEENRQKYRKNKQKSNKKFECNICGEYFYPSNKYERYCQKCRQDSEVLKNYQWN